MQLPQYITNGHHADTVEDLRHHLNILAGMTGNVL